MIGLKPLEPEIYLLKRDPNLLLYNFVDSNLAVPIYGKAIINMVDESLKKIKDSQCCCMIFIPKDGLELYKSS